MEYTVHGILQTRILEWAAVPFSRGCSQPRDGSQVSRIAGRFSTSLATREAQFSLYSFLSFFTYILLYNNNKTFHDTVYDEGKFTWADGSYFEGIYAGGLKTGKGTYKYANGDVYEGNFEQDMRQGQGKYVWASGETYEGEFYNNTFHGMGTYVWNGTDGRASYSGYFENGQIKIIKQGSNS